MAEARYRRDDQRFQLLAASQIDAGQVIQLPTGEAAFLEGGGAVSSTANTENLRTRGKVEIEKTTGQVYLPGQEVYWDYSANKLHYAKVNDRDFFVGSVCEDAVSADLTALVDLNKRQRADIDFTRDFFATTYVGTQGVNTMGIWPRAGGRKFIASTTNEAQKFELLSRDGFDKNANWIIEALFTVVSGGAAGEPDFNIGVANGTHATDFDSVTEYCALHIDGNSVNLNLQSKDGTTTVASTDTTSDYTAGSTVAVREHWLFDGRDPADIQIYRNGVLQLGSTVFRLDNAVGPLFLIAHFEKTAAATVFELDLERFRCWFSEQ